MITNPILAKAPDPEAPEVEIVAHAALPTRYGRFTIYGFKGRGPEEEAVALVRGKLNGKSAPLVRVHSQCLTGDVLTSLRCGCREIGRAECREVALPGGA